MLRYYQRDSLHHLNNNCQSGSSQIGMQHQSLSSSLPERYFMYGRYTVYAEIVRVMSFRLSWLLSRSN